MRYAPTGLLIIVECGGVLWPHIRGWISFCWLAFLSSKISGEAGKLGLVSIVVTLECGYQGRLPGPVLKDSRVLIEKKNIYLEFSPACCLFRD